MSREAFDDLAAAVLAGAEPIFDPHTGVSGSGETFAGRGGRAKPRSPGAASPGARAGYEPPRYCQLCGRALAVQVFPQGWTARCSRHGELDSAWLER
ncbi:hypothetical protein [Corynebacterium oculi]|uniref:Biotin synthase auxiliary protein n=1 Tax=Corynebacterium oculi TaxID=1544416 RepID=A0A0N8VZ90_9CORY|nr:hypothetical protein [Corynebacterium oculi]KQB83234.1 hypothetical protein Cocul_02207 [Corynebacterium oculi]